MAKAQAEYIEKTGQSLNVTEVVPSTPATSSQAYRIDGIKATEDTRGIIIQDGKKILKN